MTREQLRRAAAAVKSGDPIRAAAFVPELLEEVESLRRSLAYDSADMINYLDQMKTLMQERDEARRLLHESEECEAAWRDRAALEASRLLKAGKQRQAAEQERDEAFRVIDAIAMAVHQGPPQSLEAWGKIQTLLLRWANRRTT